MNNKIFEAVTSLDNKEPIIIAEMSGNHGNSLEKAQAFVCAAISAKPDIIKFQVYKPDTITLKSNGEDFRVHDKTIWADHGTLFDLYKIAHTPWDWIATMATQCEDSGMPWFASPFDDTAVSFLESINCPAYKLASPEVNDLGLVEAIAKTGKPFVMSTGLGSEAEVDAVIALVQKHHNSIAILKCTSSYPAPHADLNLSAIPYLKDRYNCPIGYSDHSLGDTAAIAAVALGAMIIEKHFKLDNDDISVDSQFSMAISELPNFRQKLHEARAAIGTATFDVPASAQPSLSGRRSLYVAQYIKAGDLLNRSNVKSVRPAFGMSPKFLPYVIGKRAAVDLEVGDRLTDEVIQEFDSKKFESG